MSDRARRHVVRAAGVLALLPAVLAAGAQDATALLRELERSRDRTVEAGNALKSAKEDRLAGLDDSLRAAGRLVRFNALSLPPKDRLRLVSALEAAHQSLASRFGAPAAASFVDSAAWEMKTQSISLGKRTVELEGSTVDGRNMGVFYHSLIPGDRVTAIAFLAAGAQVAARHETLSEYASTMSLEDDDERLADAARDLALSNSSIGRRCAAGAIGACRAVLTPSPGAIPLTHWYLEEDYRSVVATASRRSSARRDTSGVRLGEACLHAADDAACEQLVHSLPLGYPFIQDVRNTFAAFALETGGAAGVARLDSARGRFADDPVRLLAHVSGLTEDQLISAWQRRLVAAANADTQPPVAPLAISGAFWCGLLLLGATRRRPR